MLVTIASVQSCGVTTAALALAATWPKVPGPIVAELDPCGGDIAARFALRPEDGAEVGVVSLAAMLRRLGPAALDDPLGACVPHLQELPGGVRVLTAPSSGSDAGAAYEVLADRLPDIADASDVLADCGRLEAKTARSVARLLAASEMTLIVARPTVPSLLRLTRRLPDICATARAVAVLLRGNSPYGTAEIEEQLGVPVIGHLPEDPAAAAMLEGEPTWRRPRRLPLFRSAAAVAVAITQSSSSESSSLCEAPPAVVPA